MHLLPLEFKILLLTCIALNNQAPSYIKELITPYYPNRSLCSQNTGSLLFPRVSGFRRQTSLHLRLNIKHSFLMKPIVRAVSGESWTIPSYPAIGLDCHWNSHHALSTSPLLLVSLPPNVFIYFATCHYIVSVSLSRCRYIWLQGCRIQTTTIIIIIIAMIWIVAAIIDNVFTSIIITLIVVTIQGSRGVLKGLKFNNHNFRP